MDKDDFIKHMHTLDMEVESLEFMKSEGETFQELLSMEEEALDIWAQESKIEINKDSLFWWELFACVKGLAIWISAGHEFSTGSNTDPVNLFSAWVPGDIHTEIILDKLESLL